MDPPASPVLLLSFFTRIISEIKFTHVVFCDDYGMTGKEKEGKRSVLQRHLVDLLLLLLLISVSEMQTRVAIPLVGAGFGFLEQSND